MVMMLHTEDVRGPGLVVPDVGLRLDEIPTVEVKFLCDVEERRVVAFVEEELRPMDNVMVCSDVSVMTETSPSEAVGAAEEVKEVFISGDGDGYSVSAWAGWLEAKFVSVTVTVSSPCTSVCEAGSWLESKVEVTSEGDASPFEES